MDVTKALDRYREMKRDRVADYPEDTDLRALLVIERGDELKAMVLVGPGERAHLQAVAMTAGMFRPDVLYFLSDGHMRMPLDKTGGDKYEHGDFQRDWEAGQRAGLTECLIAQGMARDGESSSAFQAYRVIQTKGSGTTVVFDQPQIMDPLHVRGDLVDSLREGWAKGEQFERTIAVAAPRFGFDTKAEQDDVTDRIVAKLISREGHTVWLMEPGGVVKVYMSV